MRKDHLATTVFLALTLTFASAPVSAQNGIPRTADGKPDFEGIWQAQSTAAADLQDHVAGYNMLAGRSVVNGGTIPYQPWAAAKKAANFENRTNADPLGQCYIPGVPRIMYLDFPFQIFQTTQAIAMTFEWSMDYRLIYMDGSPHSMESISGWAIHAAYGKATRLSSTSATRTIRPGLIWPATSTAMRSTWSSVIA